MLIVNSLKFYADGQYTYKVGGDWWCFEKGVVCPD